MVILFFYGDILVQVRIYDNAMNAECEEDDLANPEAPEHLEMEDVELR